MIEMQILLQKGTAAAFMEFYTIQACEQQVGSIEGRDSISEVEGNDRVEDIIADTGFGSAVSGSRQNSREVYSSDRMNVNCLWTPTILCDRMNTWKLWIVLVYLTNLLSSTLGNSFELIGN